MPQSCRVCQLGPKTVKQLESDYINGVNKHQLTKRYDVGYDSVSYHLEHHLPNKIVQGAKETLQLDTTHLLEQIDQLYSWMKIIFKRNYEKGYDKTALKALSEQRNTLQLLAQISVALHKTKAEEYEQEQRAQMLNSTIPLDRLTKREQDVYFQITQKLMGNNDVTIDLGYGEPEGESKPKTKPESQSESEQVSGGTETEDLNTTKNPPAPSAGLIRRRRPEQQPQADSQEQPMRFKPIVEPPPSKDPKLLRSRRMFARAIETSGEDHSPRPSLAPTIPLSQTD